MRPRPGYRRSATQPPVMILSYIQGLRSAVVGAVDCLLAGIEAGDGPPPPVPPRVLLQARIAARGGVGLDTVLHRCVAGNGVSSDMVIGESEEAGLLSRIELRPLTDGTFTTGNMLLTGESGGSMVGVWRE